MRLWFAPVHFHAVLFFDRFLRLSVLLESNVAETAALMLLVEGDLAGFNRSDVFEEVIKILMSVVFRESLHKDPS